MDDDENEDWDDDNNDEDQDDNDEEDGEALFSPKTIMIMILTVTTTQDALGTSNATATSPRAKLCKNLIFENPPKQEAYTKLSFHHLSYTLNILKVSNNK